MGQRRSKVSHTRELGFIICLALTILLAAIGLIGPGGYLEMKRAERELEALRARVAARERANRKLMGAVRALETDPHAVERQAREQGYARPGELVQEVTPPPSSQAKPPAPR